MVTIPTVQPQVQQTGGFSAQGVQPMRSAVGEQLQQFGEGAQRAALGLYEVGLEAQQDYDTARSTELTTKLSAAARAEVDKFLRYTGRDAQSNRKATIDALESHLQALQKGVENPAQESRFAPRAAQLMSDLVRMVDDHEAKETKTYKLAELDAGVKESRRQFLFMHSNNRPGFAAAALDEAIDLTEQALQLQGIPLDSQIAQQALLNTRATMHGSVMKQLADAERLDDLKTYYASLDPERDLNPEVKERVDAVLDGMQTKADAITIAISLDQLPLGARYDKLDELFVDGKLTQAAYERASAEIDRRDARRQHEAARKRVQMVDQARAILDDDRRVAQRAAAGEFRALTEQLPIDELLPAPMIQQLKAEGLFAEVEQYAMRGRRVTTPRGLQVLNGVLADPTAKLRGVEWDTIYDAVWMDLDEQDTDRLAAQWAQVNQQPTPGGRGAGRGAGSGGGLEVVSDKEWVEGQLERLQPLGPDPDEEAIEARKKLRLMFDEEFRASWTPESRVDARTAIKEMVDRKLAEQVTLVATGEKIPLSLVGLRFTPEELRDDPTAAELGVSVPDPRGSGNEVMFTFTELRAPGVREKVTARIMEMKRAALDAEMPEEAERLQMIVDTENEFAYATIAANLKAESLRVTEQERYDTSKFYEVLKKTGDTPPLDLAWRFYRERDPDMAAVPERGSRQEWEFIQSENRRRTARLEAVRRGLPVEAYNFTLWHRVEATVKETEEMRGNLLSHPARNAAGEAAVKEALKRQEARREFVEEALKRQEAAVQEALKRQEARRKFESTLPKSELIPVDEYGRPLPLDAAGNVDEAEAKRRRAAEDKAFEEDKARRSEAERKAYAERKEAAKVAERQRLADIRRRIGEDRLRHL